MTAASGIAAKVAALSTTISPYPPSFDGNPWLYGSALASLITIGIINAINLRWMVVDLYADRYRSHPLSVLFLFRTMIGLLSLVGVVRCFPEVVYLTCYGEVTGYWMGVILTVKRVADTISLPGVILWTGILNVTYSRMVLALTTVEQRAVQIDPWQQWHRLGKPLAILGMILLCASLIAVAKGAWGHH